MSFLVKDILSEGLPPIVVLPNAPAQDALRLMAEHNFSQLPLVNEERNYQGRAVTLRSIVDAISFLGAISVPRNARSSDLPRIG